MWMTTTLSYASNYARDLGLGRQHACFVENYNHLSVSKTISSDPTYPSGDESGLNFAFAKIYTPHKDLTGTGNRNRHKTQDLAQNSTTDFPKWNYKYRTVSSPPSLLLLVSSWLCLCWHWHAYFWLCSTFPLSRILHEFFSKKSPDAIQFHNDSQFQVRYAGPPPAEMCMVGCPIAASECTC